MCFPVTISVGEWAEHFSWVSWRKTNPMPSVSKRHWTWDSEIIAYGTVGKHTFNFPEEGHAYSTWDLPKTKETGHPTEKPVSVPLMAIEHSSNEGNLVFDGFLGSGSTLVACEMSGRVCYSIEKDPIWVASVLQRWIDLTGEEPILL